MSRRAFASPINPGLIVLHSNRMEVLRDSVLHWFDAHPLDPLELEVVSVQSNGIAQWLRGTLAQPTQQGGAGIAAALDTPMPSRLMWTLYRRVLGEAAVPESSPLDEVSLVWRLMRLLGRLEANGEFQLLAHYLEGDEDLRKRYQLALRLADLYDQYQVYRADWVGDWAAGQDVLSGAPFPRPLDPAQRWQAALWREIVADVGPEGASSGRAAVHQRFIDSLRSLTETSITPDLPRRITVFGVSSLPRQTLEALVEVSRWTQVLVCVHNPCEYHWADIVEGRSLLRNVRRHQLPRPGMPPELDSDQLHAHAHPLLASWGRQGRDYIALLEELEDETSQRSQTAEGLAGRVTVAPAFVEVEGDTVLNRLQDDVRALRPLPEIREESRQVYPDDGSVCFHMAHSALREVEILHDQLLDAFDNDPGLQPDDVIVMVPDIEQYAPHIDAVFGLHGPDDARHLPYFIVDRGPARVNTVVDAVERLLTLPTSRMTVGEVLDLLEVAAVAHRFGLEEEDILVLRHWIEGANVRWGLDARHREALGLPIEPALADIHTWRFGLDRMLLGYATGEADEWMDIAPYGDVAGLEARLVGVLAGAMERLTHYARLLERPATPQEWVTRLRGLLDDFLLAPDDVAGYTLEQLVQSLDAWLDECEAAGFEDPLPVQVVGRHWLDVLAKAGLAQRFTSGAITFATLMPMRAIPFRHVCLLGMNDGDYPRPRNPMPFDLMEKDYRPGDRSRRDDDRYLFLEAMLSARERLYVSWVGRSIVDNTPRPPSVLVAQLRDHIAAAWRPAEGWSSVLEQLTTEHPLQAFSREYFEDRSSRGRLFTYAGEWRAAPSIPEKTDELLDVPARDEPLSVPELRSFLEHPVREFFRQRLLVRLDESDAPKDEESFVADGLENWQSHDALIRAARPCLEAGESPVAACDLALARMERGGLLAYGGAGGLQAQQCRQALMPMFHAYEECVKTCPQPVPESVELTHDREGTPGLAGWLSGLRRDDAGTLLRLEMQATQLVKGSRWREEKLLGHWLWHLLANGAELPLTTVVLSPAGHATFEPLLAAQARAWLDILLDAWVEGMRRPLPIKADFAHPVLTTLPSFDMPALQTPGAWQALPQAAELLAKLEKCHGTTWNQPGRRDAVHEARAFPTFASLMKNGELVEWAARLYGPLFVAVRKEGK